MASGREDGTQCPLLSIVVGCRRLRSGHGHPGRPSDPHPARFHTRSIAAHPGTVQSSRLDRLRDRKHEMAIPARSQQAGGSCRPVSRALPPLQPDANRVCGCVCGTERKQKSNRARAIVAAQHRSCRRPHPGSDPEIAPSRTLLVRTTHSTGLPRTANGQRPTADADAIRRAGNAMAAPATTPHWARQPVTPACAGCARHRMTATRGFAQRRIWLRLASRHPADRPRATVNPNRIA